MRAPIRSLSRLWVLLVIPISVVVLLSINAWTRADSSLAAGPTPVAPPSPPRHAHLAPAPAPDAAAVGVPGEKNLPGVEVIPFRPQVRLKRGQQRLYPQGVAKPPENERSSAENPLFGTRDVPDNPYLSPNVRDKIEAMDWTDMLYEDFEDESAFLANWILEDYGDDGLLFLERTWGVTDYWSQYDLQSAWPAAYGADALHPAGGYSDNLSSWMEYGPLDLSELDDAFVHFGLWYDTEPYFDEVHFCVSVDFINYNCVSWSGYSDGWTDQLFWLDSYAGDSQVWLAWVFTSDLSVSAGYGGAYVDEVYVAGYQESGISPTPTPDPAGELIVNGGFETGDLSGWEDTEMDGVDDNASAEGLYAAYMVPDSSGMNWLDQSFDVPVGTTDLVLNYWFAVGTDETEVGRDLFCASLRPADMGEIWVDLGCLEALDASGYWQELTYALTMDELALIQGQRVALVFELYTDDRTGTDTWAWLDGVHAYAQGGGQAAYLDLNEPNDDPSRATDITCSQTLTGTIGDALGGEDVDWFVVSGVAEGRLDIDIDARTLFPQASNLDSVVFLLDDGLNFLDWNDDDGVSLDSYLSYTNTVPNATFYILVESYLGYGDPDAFYDLTVQCGGVGDGPPPSSTYQPPEDVDAWTVMLYLNAEDAYFAPILTRYRTDIEAFIAGMEDYANVVILYDGPGSDDTVRYLVQPKGVYTDGVNRWSLSERNMGDPDTLESFVTWAMDHYPASHYYLAVDDHGDGVYGISFDPHSSNDQLTPPELYSALKSATRDGESKIDIFDYEACLMGLAENAYDLRRWVEYVVFSEQISWGINTYPRYFYDLAASDTPLDVGRRIVDRYYQEAIVDNSGNGYPHTISLIDASRMGAVNARVTEFANAIMSTDTQAQKDAIKAARGQSQAFASDLDATNPVRAEYIDLLDLADKASALAPSQAAAVKNAVYAAVVHHRYANGGVSGYAWDHSDSHGLSIYYPPTRGSSAFDAYVASSIYRMSDNGTWDEFLDWAVPGSGRRGMNSFRAQDRLLDADDAFAYKNIYMPFVSE